MINHPFGGMVHDVPPVGVVPARVDSTGWKKKNTETVNCAVVALAATTVQHGSAGTAVLLSTNFSDKMNS